MAIQDYITNGHHVEEEEEQQQQTAVKIDVSDRAPARIKVIGVGGGGCNCVKRMLRHAVPGVTFAMVNTDIKSLEMHDQTVDVIQIGEKETRGWGAGGDYKAGARAAEESSSQLRRILSNAELVFVTAGMGGGTAPALPPTFRTWPKKWAPWWSVWLPLRSVSRDAAVWVRLSPESIGCGHT